MHHKVGCDVMVDGWCHTRSQFIKELREHFRNRQGIVRQRIECDLFFQSRESFGDVSDRFDLQLSAELRFPNQAVGVARFLGNFFLRPTSLDA